MSNVSGGAVSTATRDDAHPPGPSRQLRRSFALIVFLILPLSLRLWPVQHGLPRSYVPDGHMVRNALGMARDGDLVPPAGKYSSYPYFVPYMLLCVYAAQYGVGDLLGRWPDAKSFGEYAMDNPASVLLPARLLVALLGAATVWLTYRCAREMGLGLGAWVAAWLVCTGLLHVHFSIQERPWIPMLFFATLSMWAAERFRRTGAARDLMFSAAGAGLSFACHQVGVLFFPVTALSLWMGLGGGRMPLARRVALGLGALGLFVAVALLVGHPYYLRFGMVPAEVAERPGDLPSDFHIGGQAALLGFSLSSVRHLAVSFFGYDPALCCLALVGLWPALRERNTRALALFACLYAVFFLSYPNDHVRYLLPLSVLLAFPAGACAERLLTLRNGAFALSLLLVLPLVQAVRFGWVMNQRDTRAEGEEVIASLDSELVAVDRYGPTVELDAASLERVQDWRELTMRELNRLRKLRENAPVERGASAVRVEDVFEGRRSYGYVVRERVRKLGETPAEVLKELGVKHLLLVDRRPGDGRAPELWESAQRGRPTYMIQPGAGEAQTREALLPTEMDFALTAIWQIDRPGPWLCLYDLEPQ